ncbi:hypothetical protein BJY01DRAFT_255206 [Aspergillus pseudoustus]|uniref:C2H2-type domain-containing protein n=1 Tax=Aspergillus pseudoustus TaxID=1810923 RepID=A0ABR4IM65_9EURO
MEQLQQPSTPTTSDKERRRFKCGRCEKRFRRSEHCARHELMHTEERPFHCSYCDKRYGRKDLLRRHERTIHAEEYKNDTTAQAVSLSAAGVEHGSGVQQEERSNRTSSSAADDDDMPETPRAIENAREVISHVGEPSGSPLPDAGPFADLELCNADPRMQLLHFLGTNSFHPLTDGSLGEPSFSYPLTANSLLPPATSPSQPSPEISAGGHPGDRDRRGTARAPLNRTNQTSMPLSPPSNRLPGEARMDIGSDSSFKATWDAPSGVEYNLDPFGLDIDLAQRPLELWSQDPDNITLHLPVIMRELPGQSPRNIFDDESFECIRNDISSRVGAPNPPKPLFSFHELQQFTNSYIDSFHSHLPFIHLASLSVASTPCPLILAMASIGALYRLQRRRAYELYELANQIEYQWRRIEVQNNKVTDRTKLTWGKWIEIEQTKRTLCAMFIFSSMLLIAFNITPGFVIERDLLIDVPDNESLWAASTAQEWEELRDSVSLLETTHHQTLQSAVQLMLQPPSADEAGLENQGAASGATDYPGSSSPHPLSMSGFTALVVMHGVNIYLWHLNQLSQTVSRVSLGIWPQENLRTALLRAASMTLDRCQATLVAGRSDEGKLAGLYDPNHIYIFNCGALLRVAGSRLLPHSNSFNRLALLTEDQAVVARAVRVYAQEPLQRTMFVTKAAKMAYNGFLGPVKIGALLVSRTAALSWGVEQAIAGWDSGAALLLTKWVHTLETAGTDNPPNSEEAQVINDLKSLLAEVDVGGRHDRNRSLAAMLAKVWASFLDDTWVWGVTLNMGSILRLLSKEYQERFAAELISNIG